ncbi:aminoglycoside phosphotransferase [Paroceanicella profunda]|uniref:Aminoglycoside phosphotransferase n=1 Tax=Paroceanicella profunda TaxID=2579971 RepID=A0A5B8FSM9_9RHOB|nr:phosphotransferase [Paroceanicella profunda]QDL91776.1 aminoglycoside phosphotransferase [Paroceanicella profunda]
MTREPLKTAFLASAGWEAASRRPLASDASARAYERLTAPDGRSAMLMDAPRERGEDVRPFLALTGWLRAGGFSAPEILAEAADDGLLLLEDLGDALYARVCAAQPAREIPLYARAVDLLAELHRLPPPRNLPAAGQAVDVTPYDAATLRREAELVTGWYLPGPVSPDLAAEYGAHVEAACAQVAGARACLVLRDYHAENLLWLPERAGTAAVGLLDYQDALRGHPAYDLVSLLEDARRDTAPELRAAMLERYIARAAPADPEAFRAAYAVLGAQRNLKITGIFARLCRRDGKPGYLRLIPRVWAHLMRDLEHPALAGLRGFVTAHVPPPGPEVLARIGAAHG